jgi:hypothetical protein
MSGATIAKLAQKAAADVSATAATSRPDPSLGEPAVTAAPLKGAAAPTTTLKDEEAAAVALKGEPAAVLAAPSASRSTLQLAWKSTLW